MLRPELDDRSRPAGNQAASSVITDGNAVSLVSGADVLADLHVPDVTRLDSLSAALAYAEAGWYVGPVKSRTKHPGSLLGDDWHQRTSREPEVLVSWYAGTDHGVFLHCGRSGALVFDVDTPERLHPLIAQAVTEAEPPWQSTRPAQPTRRHYVFAQPPGRMLGNSLGQLAGGWGEIRGRNGVIVVAPSTHEEPAGRYAWGQVGRVPGLPGYLLERLPDALDAADAATDAEVSRFLAEHAGTVAPELLEVHLRAWTRKVEAGESRHHSTTGHLAGAMKEARLGCYPAETAASTFESLFLAAVTRAGHGKQGAPRSPVQARSEWLGLLSWAVAQALAADLNAVRTRLAEKVPDLAPPPPSPPVSDLEPDEREESHEDDPHAVTRRRFPRLDLEKLLSAERPPRQWVIEGLVPAGASVALVAPAGTGKSLLLLAAMIAVARGDRTFAGLPIKPRRVLLVDMENTEDDLADRLGALGVDLSNIAQLGNLVPIHLPPLAPLDTMTGGLELSAILDAYRVRPGDVVVLDSLHRVINGAENDSDTMRAYYRHTAVMLKRRGVTVVRTDNTGKDADKGARGTSGKRDDVDVELILSGDAERPERFYLRPGKTRLPGIRKVTINRQLDDEGLLTYSTAGDPFRAHVADALVLLDEHKVPLGSGERPAAQVLKAAGHKVTREALRVALRERKLIAFDPSTGAPNAAAHPLELTPPSSAPSVNGAATAQHPTSGGTGRETCADDPPRTLRATETGAPAAGAPPLPLSKERRTGARSYFADLVEGDVAPVPPRPMFCADCGEELDPERAAINSRCLPCWERLLANQPQPAERSAS